MISQCMNEREQFKLMHVKNDLRRIIVLSNMTKFRLANPCQNKESKVHICEVRLDVGQRSRVNFGIFPYRYHV